MSETEIAVKYIFRRPRWKDNLYGSGLEFTTGQTRMLPSALALKLLRHGDTFARDTEFVPTPKTTEQETTELLEQAEKRKDDENHVENQRLDLYAHIDRMDKDAIGKFAREHYRVEVDRRRGIDALRTQAKELIDRFGMP